MQEFKLGKMIALGTVILVGLIVLFGSCGSIGAGDIGVKTRLGRVVGVLQPGLYFKIPFIDSVTDISVQTQKVELEADAASSDLQTVSTKIAVNYQLLPDHVSAIYSNVGVDYQEVVIDPAIQESMKASTAKYTAEELISKREQVRQDVIVALNDKLSSRGIQVGQVAFTDFQFSPQFNQAIEAKVTAEQNALAAKNKLDQVTYEAQQTVTSAKAQAEAIQIQAQAINSQGGADYVELQRIKAWDGHACTSYCGLQTSTGLLISGK